MLGLDPVRDAVALQQRIGVQLQEAQLQKRIKVWEAVDFWASLYRTPVDGDRLLEQLGLTDKRDAWFMTLSGGQKQRLFIALALINDPELVFLDELTTGLDPQARRAIWELVRGIRERGKTVFLTTHLMEEAERLCDRVAIIDHGRIVDIGHPADLVARHCPERTVVVTTGDPSAEARFGAIPRVATVDAGRPGRHHPRPRRRSRDARDPLPRRAPHRGGRLPHRAADARGRVPQADRPRDPRLRPVMLRGLWRLTWLEIKIFLREPLGAIGGIAVPVVAFVIMSRVGRTAAGEHRPACRASSSADLPIFAGLLIVASAVLSLVAIIAIYREGGILKRLRATPLRPYTILTAHVLVKLLFTAVTLAALVVAGRRVYPLESGVPILSFAVALLFSTLCVLALGFLIASLVPTARFAQPIGTLILYPMLGVSGSSCPSRRCRPSSADWRGCCRSRMRCRSCAASGTARAGSPMPATSASSRSCSSPAWPCRRASSAGSDGSRLRTCSSKRLGQRIQERVDGGDLRPLGDERERGRVDPARPAGPPGVDRRRRRPGIRR